MAAKELGAYSAGAGGIGDGWWLLLLRPMWVSSAQVAADDLDDG